MQVEMHDLGEDWSVMFHKDGTATFFKAHGDVRAISLPADSLETLRKIINKNYRA